MMTAIENTFLGLKDLLFGGLWFFLRRRFGISLESFLIS